MAHNGKHPLAYLWTNWSPSKLACYIQCPLQFYWNYVCKLDKPVCMPKIMGIGLHRMFDTFFRQTFKSPESFINRWKYLWWFQLKQEFGFDSQADNAGMFYGKGVKMLRTFWDANIAYRDSASLKPQTEIRIQWSLGLCRMTAVLDRIQPTPDRGQTIIDYKTGFDKKRQAGLLRDVQLTICQLAHRQRFGCDPHGLELHYPAYPAENGQSNWPWEVLAAPIRSDQQIRQLLAILNQARIEVQAKITGGLSAEDRLLLFKDPRQADQVAARIAQAAFLPRAGKHCRHCDFEIECRDWDPNSQLTPEHYWAQIIDSKIPADPQAQQLSFDFKPRRKQRAKSKKPS